MADSTLTGTVASPSARSGNATEAQASGASQTPAASTHVAYNPAIDGLRAVAIIGVVGVHAGLSSIAGYHGVTLFFVVSGYLITSLLISEHARTGTIRLRQFYRRRMARLGPALVLVIAVTTAWLLLIARPLGSYWAGVVGSLSYTMDLIQPVWGNGAVGNYYQYTWSLGIEEQFYLVWPILLLVLLRRRSLKLAAGVLVTGVVLFWFLRAVQDQSHPTSEAKAFSPISHADALLLGALVAVIMVTAGGGRTVGVLARVLGPLGVALLVFATIDGSGLWGIRSVDSAGYGQVAVASAAVVLWVAAAPTGLFARVLALRPLVFIGTLSYELYLWNLVLIWMFTLAFGVPPAQTWLGLAYIAVLLTICYCSWRFVEAPLRRRWASRRDVSRTREADRSFQRRLAVLGPAADAAERYVASTEPLTARASGEPAARHRGE